MKDVYDFMGGNTVQRIMHINTGSIVVKKSELSIIVHSYNDQSKGEGALKLVYMTRNQSDEKWHLFYCNSSLRCRVIQGFDLCN